MNIRGRKLAEIGRSGDRDRRDQSLTRRDQHHRIVHDADRHFRRVLICGHLLQVGQRIGAFVDDLDPKRLLDDREHIRVEILGGPSGTSDDDFLTSARTSAGAPTKAPAADAALAFNRLRRDSCHDDMDRSSLSGLW